MNIYKHFPVFILLLLQLHQVFGQEKITAVRFRTPPIIDGIISEETWLNMEPVTSFIQREPQNGQPFSQRTEVYFGLDENNLYIAFRCFGDPDNITAKELARDVSLGNDDRVRGLPGG